MWIETFDSRFSFLVIVLPFNVAKLEPYALVVPRATTKNSVQRSAAVRGSLRDTTGSRRTTGEKVKKNRKNENATRIVKYRADVSSVAATRRHSDAATRASVTRLEFGHGRSALLRFKFLYAIQLRPSTDVPFA